LRLGRPVESEQALAPEVVNLLLIVEPLFFCQRGKERLGLFPVAQGVMAEREAEPDPGRSVMGRVLFEKVGIFLGREGIELSVVKGIGAVVELDRRIVTLLSILSDRWISRQHARCWRRVEGGGERNQADDQEDEGGSGRRESDHDLSPSDGWVPLP